MKQLENKLNTILKVHSEELAYQSPKRRQSHGTPCIEFKKQETFNSILVSI